MDWRRVRRIMERAAATMLSRIRGASDPRPVVENPLGFEDAVSARMRGSRGYRPLLVRAAEKYGSVAPCTLSVDAQPTGAHAGGPRIHAVVEGIGEVGMVEARYRASDPEFFDAVLAGARSGWVIISREGRDPVSGRLVVRRGDGTGEPVWPPAEPASRTPDLDHTAGLPSHGRVRWLPTGAWVEVLGDENVEVLLSAWLGDQPSRQIVVTLWTEALDGSRDKGIRVWAFDQEVGWLGAKSSRAVIALVDAATAEGLTAVARAEIVRRKRRPEIMVEVGPASRRR